MVTHRDGTNIQNKQKVVNLFDFMLSSFKGDRRTLCNMHAIWLMDDIMALIAHNIWKINMVGIIQPNCTGTPMRVDLKANSMKKRAYEYRILRHNS